MRDVLIRLVTATVVLAWLPGCAASPRQRPLPTSEIEAGPNTVEYARRQLEGTWTLQRFEIVENGLARDVRANGRLTYDAYGNLAVTGVVLDPADEGVSAAAPLLNYTGQIVIDPVRHEFRLTDVRSREPLDPKVRGVLDPWRIRRYSFEDGRLVLVLVAENGEPAARATFSREP
jgi:hypothetical protein